MSRRALLGALLLCFVSLSPVAAQDQLFLLPGATETSPFSSGLGPRDPLATSIGTPASLGIAPAAATTFPRLERTLPATVSPPGAAPAAAAVLPGPTNTSLLMPGRYDYGSFRHIPKPTTTTTPLSQLNVSTTTMPAATNLKPSVSPLGDLKPVLQAPNYAPLLPLGTR